MRGTLTQQQIDLLTQPLDPKRVKQSQGQSHLEGWDVRAHLTRIFGFDGWDEQLLTVDLVSERAIHDDKKKRDGWFVVYRCTMRLTIWGDTPEGERAVAKISEEGAVGGAQNQPDLAAAHDLAMKEAMTQALKRCAINLGNQFGLSLYDGGSTASVAAPIEAIPDGALPELDAKKRVKNAVAIAFPNASDDYVKATAAGIWTEASPKTTTISGAKYLLADEVKVLDSVCKDEIQRLLAAPVEGAA